jgi:hypothetical protein
LDLNFCANDEIMNIKEVCKFLKISKGTLRKLNISYIKVRRRVLYRKMDIEQFILKNTKEVKYDS